MIKITKKLVIYAATLALVFQGFFNFSFISMQKAYAATNNVYINEFVSNPDSTIDYGCGIGKECVELYNDGITIQSLADWYITDLDGNIKYNFTLPDSIPAKGYFVISMGSTTLNNDDDGLILYDTDGVDPYVDSVRYGAIPTHMMPAPTKGKSASRVYDGASCWASSTPSTIGLSNGNISLPELPTNAFISANTGSNPVNTINKNNYNNIRVSVTLPETSLTENSVTAVISTPLKPSGGTYFSTNSAHPVSNGATTLDITNLNSNYAGIPDGTIKVGAYVSNANGESSEYFVGTDAIKDTVNPNPATAASVASGVNNSANVINSFNKTAVSANVTLPDNSLTSDNVTLEFSDSTNSLSYNHAGLNGTGSITFASLDLHTLNDGNITVSSFITDAAGNKSTTFQGVTVLKDTIAPTGTISINSNATNANNANVTLGLTATNDTALMEFSTDNVTYSNPEVFNTSKTFSLPVGDGTKTVYVKFIDNSGNISGEYHSNIILDVTYPLVDVGADIAANSQISRTATVDGAISGVASYLWSKVSGPGTITFGSANLGTTTMLASQDGSYVIRLTVTDNAGNTNYDEMTLTWDTTAPTGTITINNKATVSSTNNVALTLTTDDAAWMMISNAVDFAGAGWQTFNASKSWTLDATNGTKAVYVKFKDAVGNISQAYSDSVTLDSNINSVVTNNIGVGNQTLSPSGGLEIIADGLTTTTLTTATYTQNPGSSMPTGINAFGKYYEMAFDSSTSVSWPVLVKIYYTLADLNAAGISSESQLMGIYYWDTQSLAWKLYANTGVNTNDVIINNISYAGYVWAMADHFTPIIIGSDITAPTKPANFTATSGDGKISLKWEKVLDAQGYYVRYREGTSIDDKAYTTVYLSGNNTLSTEITGLKNSTLYEFGIQAIDLANNKSEWGVIVASPVASETTQVAISQAPLTSTTSRSIASSTTKNSEGQVEITTNPNGPEVTVAGPTDEEGKIKAEQSSTTNWTRFWVTIAILLVAFGAGYGGYYGYQALLVKEENPKGKSKKPEKPTSGRW